MSRRLYQSEPITGEQVQSHPRDVFDPTKNRLVRVLAEVEEIEWWIFWRKDGRGFCHMNQSCSIHTLYWILSWMVQVACRGREGTSRSPTVQIFHIPVQRYCTGDTNIRTVWGLLLLVRGDGPSLRQHISSRQVLKRSVSQRRAITRGGLTIRKRDVSNSNQIHPKGFGLELGASNSWHHPQKRLAAHQYSLKSHSQFKLTCYWMT